MNCLFFESHEKSPHSFTARLKAASQAGLDQFLEDGAVNVKAFQQWCDDPDVVEGNICEFTSPFGGNTDTIAESCKLITDADPHVKAGVGEFPDTVNTVDTFGLSKDIFKLDLKNRDKFYFKFSNNSEIFGL